MVMVWSYLVTTHFNWSNTFSFDNVKFNYITTIETVHKNLHIAYHLFRSCLPCLVSKKYIAQDESASSSCDNDLSV